MADALFFLRHRLDPVANPGDFRALIGSTYEPGQYAVLQRGLDDEKVRTPLDIGGLWQDADQPGGHIFFDAKREVLLLMALLEPGFPEALAAARQLAAAEKDTVGRQQDESGAPPRQRVQEEGEAGTVQKSLPRARNSTRHRTARNPVLRGSRRP